MTQCRCTQLAQLHRGTPAGRQPRGDGAWADLGN